MTQLTALEQDILARFYERHGDRGFPSPQSLVVTSRDNDGGGRFTRFFHPGHVTYPDGPLGLGYYSQFDMDGLPWGASFHVWIAEQKVVYLDIAPNGIVPWDGTEGRWAFIDPDTGLSEAATERHAKDRF